MHQIAEKKCLLHPEREAAAVCLECGEFFCRECITEHEGRVMCSRCLSEIESGEKRKKARFKKLRKGLQLAAGLIIIWAVFFHLGKAVVETPASFHEGTIWETLGDGGL